MAQLVVASPTGIELAASSTTEHDRSSTVQPSGSHGNMDHSQGDSAEKEPSSNTAQPVVQDANPSSPDTDFKPDYRFWIILATFSGLVFLATLENTIIGTALPSIVRDLNIGSNYIWVAHIQMLAGTALMPLVAQLANIFGRRWMTLTVTVFFIIGSALCGAATNEAIMLAGRALQGIASQNSILLIEMVIADLVPLRQRSKYIGMTLGLASVSIICGPILSGFIVDNTTWRWIFYLNLPIAGVLLILLYIFLRLKWNREETIATKLKRIDWIGNTLVTAASTSVLISLTWADVIHPWHSAQVLAPLIVGVVGLVVFVLWEQHYATEPVIPIRIFHAWSAIIIYIYTFLLNFCLFFPAFFLPLFFQAVQGSSPGRAGVQMIPYTAFMFPSMIFTAVYMPKLARYKALHVVGFIIMTAGQGLFALLKRGDSTAQWVCKTMVQPIGAGFLVGSTLPAIQSWSSEADMAAATAGFTYVRSIGLVFGLSIPATIFNTYVGRFASRIADAEVRALMTQGDAFALGTKSFVMQHDDPVQSRVRETFQLAVQKAFQATIAFAGFGFVLSLITKDNTLRSELETQYGLEEKRKKEGTAVGKCV